MYALHCFLVAVVASALAIGVCADPSGLLPSRNGKTFSYRIDYKPSASGTQNVSFDGTSSLNGEENVVIWTENMNTVVSAMLRTYMSNLPKKYQTTFAECYKNSSYTGNCVNVPKAYMQVSKVSDCPFNNMVCCPLYWVSSTQQAGLPLGNVDVRTILWNGVSTVNNFFANFSKTTTNEDCVLPSSSAISTETYMAVDAHGEWAPVSPFTFFVMKEVDITSNTNATADAAKLLGADPSTSLARNNAVLTMITPVVAISVTSAVIGILIVVLIFFAYSELKFSAQIKSMRSDERSTVERASSHLSQAHVNKGVSLGNPFAQL